MISGIGTHHDTIDPVIDVLAVAIAISGIEIFEFKTEVIACPPYLRQENKPKVKSAMSCNDT